LYSGSPAPLRKVLPRVMTLTFENDNEVIVYALERIIRYARKHQYIFVAQSIWWIASVISLTEGLVTHIDNLRIQEVTKSVGSILKDQPDRKDCIIPQDVAVCLGNTVALGKVHPDRRNQINDNNSAQSSDSGSGRATSIIRETKEFLNKSRKERKKLRRKSDLLSRTRSGQIPSKALTRKQRKKLQAIPKDTIVPFKK